MIAVDDNKDLHLLPTERPMMISRSIDRIPAYGSRITFIQRIESGHVFLGELKVKDISV